MLMLTLKVEGYGVETASSGQEAIQQALKYRPDVIVLDVMMPRMDGYEVCRRLRRMPDFAKTPILFLSARSQVEDKVEGLHSGGDSYVTKPVSPQELIARIAALLGTYASDESISYVAALFGSKAGVGTTTIAVNLALALQARAGARVVLVDGHAEGGDVGVFLNLVSGHHVGELVGLIDQLDPEVLSNVLVEHASGLRVLMAPPDALAISSISPPNWERIVERLCQMADFVIFDGPPLRSAVWMPVLDIVDDVFLITTPVITAMRRLGLAHNLAESRRRLPANIHVLVNRYTEQSGFSLGAITRTLGTAVHAHIEDVGPLNTYAINRGVPLVLSDKRSSLARAIRNLARGIIEQRPSTVARKEGMKPASGLRRLLPFV